MIRLSNFHQFLPLILASYHQSKQPNTNNINPNNVQLKGKRESTHPVVPSKSKFRAAQSFAPGSFHCPLNITNENLSIYTNISDYSPHQAKDHPMAIESPHFLPGSSCSSKDFGPPKSLRKLNLKSRLKRIILRIKKKLEPKVSI